MSCFQSIYIDVRDNKLDDDAPPCFPLSTSVGLKDDKISAG